MATAKKTSKKTTRSTSKASSADAAGSARLVVDISTALHRKLKARAAQRGTSIRAYVLSLLEGDGLRD
jgi:predicted HicB family RNase H-like nuclease